MTSPKSSGKPKRRKFLIIRRVHGRSMMPFLNPGQIVIGVGWFRQLKPRDVIIFEHDGREKIKRVVTVDATSVEVTGDNPSESTDSRHFGRVELTAVRAKVIS